MLFFISLSNFGYNRETLDIFSHADVTFSFRSSQISSGIVIRHHAREPLLPMTTRCLRIYSPDVPRSPIDYAEIIFSDNRRGNRLRRERAIFLPLLLSFCRRDPLRFYMSIKKKEEIALSRENGITPRTRGAEKPRVKGVRNARGAFHGMQDIVSHKRSYCDPRVLQIPFRALWLGINPFLN